MHKTPSTPTKTASTPTKTASTANIDLRCFVGKLFLSQIYAIFWRTIYRPKNALAYKKLQIWGKFITSIKNGAMGAEWESVVEGFSSTSLVVVWQEELATLPATIFHATRLIISNNRRNDAIVLGGRQISSFILFTYLSFKYDFYIILILSSFVTNLNRLLSAFDIPNLFGQIISSISSSTSNVLH